VTTQDSHDMVVKLLLFRVCEKAQGCRGCEETLAGFLPKQPPQSSAGQ